MTDLYAYNYVFKGLNMGGNVTTIAPSRVKADASTREFVDAFGFPDDEIELVGEPVKILKSKATIVYSNNGDY